jgi:outer membrane protein OmpA-like peptidoglycan-associated protein
MKNLFCYIFVIITLTFSAAAQSIDLKKPLNEENYGRWHTYIQKYAPADSAFRVVINIANRHYFAKRSAIAAEVYKIYRPLFPNKDSVFKNQIDLHHQIMLTQDPKPIMFHIYVAFIRMNAPDEDAFVAVQRLAGYYLKKGATDSAYAVYHAYRPLFPAKQQRFFKILELLKAPSANITIENVGPPVSSRHDEWDPNLSPNGRALYFSSDGRKNGHGGADIWASIRKDGKWTRPRNAGPVVNDRRDNTIDNISPDGNTLFLSGNFAGTLGNFDIYTISRDTSGWGSLVHYPPPINSIHTDEAANLTPDGRAVIFTSDRKNATGGYFPMGKLRHGCLMGNMDIYISFRTDSGWSEPVNLGDDINTPFSERSPFLHPDGRTLYFSSDGHAGLGRLDVFKSVRKSDTSWTDWSEPVNLGRQINTPGDDWGYYIDPAGRNVYYAAKDRPGGFGGWDIYRFELPAAARPEPTATISGRIYSAGGEPIKAEIKWEDLATGKEMGRLRSNPVNGSYFVAVPTGRNYGFYAEKEGYYPASFSLDLRTADSSVAYIRNIEMTSAREMIDSAKSITINNLFFDFDQARLKPESYPELNRLAKFLKQNPGRMIEITGHTDSVGTRQYNIDLSLRRAEAVADYLERKGVDPQRLAIRGEGAENPLSENTSETGRSRNRRVEINFINGASKGE